MHVRLIKALVYAPQNANLVVALDQAERWRGPKPRRCIDAVPCSPPHASRLRITSVPASLSCQPCLRPSKATQSKPSINGIADT